MRVLAIVALLGAQAVTVSAVSMADLHRARQKKPGVSSKVAGSSRDGVFEAISEYVKEAVPRWRACEEFALQELQAVENQIKGRASLELNEIYSSAGDPRDLKKTDPSGHKLSKQTRDGLCAQVLMLWAHHIPEALRADFFHLTLPLMPQRYNADQGTTDTLYRAQTTCTACHYAKGVPEAAVTAPGAPRWGGNSSVMSFSSKVRMYDVADSPRTPEWYFNYYYDASVRASRYDHLEGQADEVCRGVRGMREGAPCTVMFATDGYVYVNSSGVCCMRNAGSWGAVRTDWIIDGGRYGGKVTLNDTIDKIPITTDMWLKEGRYDNHYYVTADSLMRPVRYMEHKQGAPKVWDFIPSTYRPGPQPRSLFIPEPGCKRAC